MLHCSKKGVFLLLAGFLLINSVGAAAPAAQITGPRVKNLKIYSSPSTASQVAVDKKLQLSFPIKIEQRKGGWLQIKHGSDAYWVQKFQVKTDKVYEVHKPACLKDAHKTGGYGSVRGMDGGCPK